MLNKSIHFNSFHTNTTKYVDRHITEIRAPTDESIKILQEMQDKIEQRFLGSFPLKNNIFDAKVFAFKEYSGFENDIKILIKYKINGQDFHTNTSVSGGCGLESMIENCKNAVIKSMASYALEFGLDNIDQETRRVLETIF
jgi:hypothetical protein